MQSVVSIYPLVSTPAFEPTDLDRDLGILLVYGSLQYVAGD